MYLERGQVEHAIFVSFPPYPFDIYTFPALSFLFPLLFMLPPYPIHGVKFGVGLNIGKILSTYCPWMHPQRHGQYDHLEHQTNHPTENINTQLT